MSTALSVGAEAPDFELPASGGQTVRLNDLRGKTVVLYFYPKDDTSGCTLEARSSMPGKANSPRPDAEIVGVSPDSVKSHDKFAREVRPRLRARAPTRARRCWRPTASGPRRACTGARYMGVERTTVLIDRDGTDRPDLAEGEGAGPCRGGAGGGARPGLT